MILRKISVIAWAILFGAANLCANEREQLSKAAELNNSGIQKAVSKDLNDAEVDLLKALVYSNEHPDIRKNLGKVHHEQGIQFLNEPGRELEALRYFQKALEIEPEHPVYKKSYSAALYQMAKKRADSGSVEEALDYYERAALMNPDDINIWVNAADYAWSVHSKMAAQMFYERARAINPLNRNVKVLQKKLTDFTQDESGLSMQSEHFRLIGAPERIGGVDVLEVLKDLEYALNQVLYALNTEFNKKISVIFYPPDAFHYQFDIPDYVVGLYDGKVRLPYPDTSHTLSRMYPVVKHELTHAVLHAIAGRSLPKWLDEGLAQKIEGREIDYEQEELLYNYELSLPMPDIAQIDQHIRSRNRWAYLKAHSFTVFLVQEQGMYEVVQCIRGERGLTFESCLESLSGLDMKEFETLWRQKLGTRVRKL